ncbi:phage tail assembly protein [Falsiroseomonas tokyonensis]|uniref:Phage tail assembly protein n=1 Tax=Falsiroseomonas tokyonensis TaxID=430521 RepID=A0ABV7BSW8_9PROT|nr:phage tail assembly protein [Falsiroseomonas tokyonensis]MBU8538731.1 phage tail assembly protein [Falsiroseomonas tokyonensis]
MSTKLKLSAPIPAHGAQLHELTLRDPSGRDLRECGLPYRLLAEGGVVIDGPASHRMIAQLAAVPPSSIDQLTGADWNAAAQVVLTMVAGQQLATVENALAEVEAKPGG